MTDDWGYDRDNQWGVGIEVIQKEHCYNYFYAGNYVFASLVAIFQDRLNCRIPRNSRCSVQPPKMATPSEQPLGMKVSASYDWKRVIFWWPRVSTTTRDQVFRGFFPGFPVKSSSSFIHLFL